MNLADFDKTIIRPTCERLWLAFDIQFNRRFRVGTSAFVTPSPHRRQLADTQFFQVDLNHFASGLFGEPSKNFRIDDRREVPEGDAAGEDRFFARVGTQHDRRVGRSAVRFGQLDRFTNRVFATTEKHFNATGANFIIATKLSDPFDCLC